MAATTANGLLGLYTCPQSRNSPVPLCSNNVKFKTLAFSKPFPLQVSKGAYTNTAIFGGLPGLEIPVYNIGNEPTNGYSDYTKYGRTRRIIRSVMEPPSKEMKAASVSVGHAYPLESEMSSQARAGEWRILPDLWRTLAQRHGNRVALYDPHRIPAREVTYQELEQAILDLAEGLRVYGIEKGECVSLFSDNSHRWIIADQGVMAVGASDAVRGAKAPASELVHIAVHSESSALIVENEELLTKMAPKIRESTAMASQIKFAVTLWSPASVAGQNGHAKGVAAVDLQSSLDLPFPVHTYEELMAAGRTSRQALAAADKQGELQAPNIRPDDVATVVYTSGTSGNPKGVMLTHANLMHQINHLDSVISPSVGDTVLSLLPPWHMYERSAEYFVLSHGTKQVYSSVKTFKEDLSKYPPDYFVAVPLVFDILYTGVQKKLAAASATRAAIAKGLVSASLKYTQAKRVLDGLDLASARRNESRGQAAVEWVIAAITAAFLLPLHLLAIKLVHSKVRAALGIKKIAVSGGGSLPPHVDKFFAAIGIMLLNGYGLTETAPVLTARKPHSNVLGTIGTPVPETEIRIVDPDTEKVLPMGSKGIVKARGPQVMKGYYRNPAATAASIDEEGFFNTGDLGWLVPYTTYGAARNCGGQLVLDGRAKDTIVLANGENVEPAVIEEAALQSKVVQQVMVVGQDKRKLGALIVPNKEELDAVVESLRITKGSDWQPTVNDLCDIVRADLNRSLKEAGCVHDHEWIGTVALLEEPFTVDNELLTATMKMKREVIAQKYESQVAALYK